MVKMREDGEGWLPIGPSHTSPLQPRFPSGPHTLILNNTIKFSFCQIPQVTKTLTFASQSFILYYPVIPIGPASLSSCCY